MLGYVERYSYLQNVRKVMLANVRMEVNYKHENDVLIVTMMVDNFYYVQVVYVCAPIE